MHSQVQKSFQNQIAKSEDSLYNQTTLLTMAILSILQARIFCPFPLEHKSETVHGLIPPPPAPSKNALLTNYNAHLPLFPRRSSSVHLSKMINLSHHPILLPVSCVHLVLQMKHFIFDTRSNTPEDSRNGVG